MKSSGAGMALPMLWLVGLLHLPLPISGSNHQIIVDLEAKDFYSNFFKPKDDFRTEAGAQAACLLDKANHIATFTTCHSDRGKIADGAIRCSKDFFESTKKGISECCTGKTRIRGGMGWANAESTLCTNIVQHLLGTLNGLMDQLFHTEQDHCFDGTSRALTAACSKAKAADAKSIEIAFDENTQGAMTLFESLPKAALHHERTKVAATFMKACNPLCNDQKAGANINDADVASCGLRNFECYNYVANLQQSLGWETGLHPNAPQNVRHPSSHKQSGAPPPPGQY